MKKVLLFAMALTAVSAFGQIKMTSMVVRNYDASGAFDGIDSTQFTYAWDMGEITSFEPQFLLYKDAPVYLYNYVEPILDYDSREIWGNLTYPLSNNASTTKTYDMNGNCILDEGSGFREEFTYTPSGMLATRSLSFEMMPGVWELSDSVEFYYDASDRMIARFFYNGGTGQYEDLDSLWYDGATSNVTILKRFESADGINFDLIERSETFWSGNDIDYVEYYEDEDGNPMTPLTYLLYGEYTYTGPNVTQFQVYPVVLGVPQSTVAAQWDYTFNANNQLLTDSQTGAFGEYILTYTYNADNLLATSEYQEDNGMGSMAVSRTQAFYYTDYADVEEIILDVTVSPNPATDKIQLSGNWDQVRVYDMNGNLMIKQVNGTSVDVSALSTGSYVVKASNGATFGTTTFIKK